MMDTHAKVYRPAGWLALLLLLGFDSAALAATPICGQVMRTDTTFDSDLICRSSAVFLLGSISAGVTVDCAGHRITTTNRNASALFAIGVDGVTIRNCEIVTEGNLSAAINLNNTSNSLITNNTITTLNTYSQGIQLIGSSGNTLSDNRISSSGIASRGMHVAAGSSNNQIAGNDLYSELTIGMLIRGGANANSLVDNTIESTSTHALEIHSASDNIVDTNTIISPASFLRIQNAPLQNGGLSVDPAGNLWGVENDLGSFGGPAGEVATLYQIDPATGSTVTAVRLVSGGADLGFGFDALEVLANGRFLALRGGGLSDLYELNPLTGEITPVPIALPALDGSLNGLQALDSQTLLASTNQGELVRIDLATGSASVIGRDGRWSDLAMHPTSGRLYTLSRWSLESSGTAHLYEIDPDSGSIIQEIGDTGFAFLSDLDFAPDGVLYASNGLIVLDPLTGLGTYLGGFGPDPFEQRARNNVLINQSFSSTTDARVEFIEPIYLPAELQLTLDISAIQTDSNRLFVDSALYPFLDVPARITFDNLDGDIRDIVVDNEDDGSFEPCDPPQCSVIDFTDGTLIFEVSGFTTYSSVIHILSSEEAIEKVLVRTESLLGDAEIDAYASKYLESARQRLREAFEKLEAGDRDRGLKQIGYAVRYLDKAASRTDGVRELIDCLVEAVRIEARDAIAAAVSAGGRQKYIDRADARVAQAENDLANGKPGKAIDHLRHAIGYALEAREPRGMSSKSGKSKKSKKGKKSEKSSKGSKVSKDSKSKKSGKNKKSGKHGKSRGHRRG